MRKILLVLSVVLLTSGCLLPAAHRRHRALLKAAHDHGHACGHVYVDGVWVVVR